MDPAGWSTPGSAPGNPNDDVGAFTVRTGRGPGRIVVAVALLVVEGAGGAALPPPGGGGPGRPHTTTTAPAAPPTAPETNTAALDPGAQPTVGDTAPSPVVGGQTGPVGAAALQACRVERQTVEKALEASRALGDPDEAASLLEGETRYWTVRDGAVVAAGPIPPGCP